MVGKFAVGISDGPHNFVSIRWPIRGFSKVQFATNALVIGDDEITVLVDPTLTSKQIMNASCHFIPAIMIAVLRKSNIDRS